jgi:hypothetical protein
MRPSTGVLTFIVTIIGLLGASYYENLAAAYCALGFGMVVYFTTRHRSKAEPAFGPIWHPRRQNGHRTHVNKCSVGRLEQKRFVLIVPSQSLMKLGGGEVS